MSNNRSNNLDIDNLLKDLFKEPSLREIFEQRLKNLNISTTAALTILEMQHRSLNGLLDGTQRVVDYTYFLRLSSFLQIPRQKVIKLYTDALESNYPTSTISADKVGFIKENFDLAALKKAKIIESVTDFKHIEQRLIDRLGLKSIFEYQKLQNDVAFSAGLIEPKNGLSRTFWINAARYVFEEINNPHEYDRGALVKYFPTIRWHCTNIRHGLTDVIRSLFNIGITVIYQPTLPNLRLRGATFSINGKPAIVLSNYMGFYATLWFALIHELYHVLFDWDEIKSNRYHLTDDNIEELTVLEKEKLANDFSRKYLFSKEKLAGIKKYLNDKEYIENVAKDNHVERSMIYVFAASDSGFGNRRAWGRARKESPDITQAIENIDIPWFGNDNTFEAILQKKVTEIFFNYNPKQ